MTRRDDFEQVALGTPLDNDSNDYDAENVQEALEEIDFRQLTKDPTGFPNRIDSAFSFDNGTLTFSIWPTGTSFDYYIRGHKFTISSTDTATITDTEGLWYIYYTAIDLIATQTPWDFEDESAWVAFLYWDATNNEAIIFGEERHGLAMDWATHKRLHKVVGTDLESGSFRIDDYILDGDGSLDAHAQISFSDGYIHDEDIIMHVTHAATPTNYFEQVLDPIAKIPLYYMEGIAPNIVARKVDATNFPVAYDGVNPIKYNYRDPGTGNWSLQSITNNWFMNMWVVATNNVEEPLVAFVGIDEYQTLIQAAEQSKDKFLDFASTIPFQEFHFVWRLIFQSNTSYTNTPKAALRQATDTDVFIINNDRYQTTGWYTGNAGTNKYLFFSPVDDSFNAPFPFPENSYIRTISLKTVANSTGTMSIYRKSAPTTPVITITFSNENTQLLEYSEPFAKSDEIFVRVTSGSFNKPSLRIWVQTEL